MNPIGLETLALSFDRTDEATLTLATRTGRFVMPVGLDAVYRFSETSPSGQAVGLKGTWRSEREFVLRYDEIAGPSNFIMHLNFEGDGIDFRLDDPTGMWSFATHSVHELTSPR